MSAAHWIGPAYLLPPINQQLCQSCLMHKNQECHFPYSRRMPQNSGRVRPWRGRGVFVEVQIKADSGSNVLISPEQFWSASGLQIFYNISQGRIRQGSGGENSLKKVLPTNMLVLITSTGAVSVVVTSPEIMLAPTCVDSVSPPFVIFIHADLASL